MDEGPGNDDSILSWLASSNPILVPQAGLDIGLEKGQARALWFSRESGPYGLVGKLKLV
jgi:hypothetical protein